jgi:hypothetical protein
MKEIHAFPAWGVWNSAIPKLVLSIQITSQNRLTSNAQVLNDVSIAPGPS